MKLLRTVFITLSKTPPALMLLVIIGLAVLVTMMVTGRMTQLEQELELGETHTSKAAMAPVIVSIDKIPDGSTITKQMVKQSRLSERTIWEDAITTAPNVVGRVTKHTIPANSQIREEDLK